MGTVWSLSNRIFLRNLQFPSIIDAITIMDPGEHVFYAGGRDGKVHIAALNADSSSSKSHCCISSVHYLVTARLIMVSAVPSIAPPFIVMMALPILASDKGLDLEIQQGSAAAAEMGVEKLKLDCTQSMQMLQRWKKMYDNFHEFCEDELLDGDDMGSANQILTRDVKGFLIARMASKFLSVYLPLIR
ncbi:hypothetical protein POTOM_010200 [Populus tomentosa]|uniref:Uncharacterized protein n=1 Tax=Populus tomentosa TaxID=118781 RepID=A0A8X8DCB6_POPTO|nr:hypothetical protein POTOM_010200 [Populus tomentosa]